MSGVDECRIIKAKSNIQAITWQIDTNEPVAELWLEERKLSVRNSISTLQRTRTEIEEALRVIESIYCILLN